MREESSDGTDAIQEGVIFGPGANLTDKLRQIRKRRLVAEFCRRCGKSRIWFYNADRDQMAKEMTHIDAVLAISATRS